MGTWAHSHSLKRTLVSCSSPTSNHTVGICVSCLTRMLPVQSHSSALEFGSKSTNHIPGHYWFLPSVDILVVIAVVTYHLCCMKKKQRKLKRYTSGSADELDHIRPFLLHAKRIDLNDVIGQGKFGVVHQGFLNYKRSSKVVAVKVLDGSVSTAELVKEVEFLQKVRRHPNVVSLIGFALNARKNFLVLEYCALGNLHNRLLKLKKEVFSSFNRPCSDQNQVPKGYYGIILGSYIHQIALGMKHISSLKIIHGDLAARNILLCNEGHVKIANFGLSKDVYETQYCNISKEFPLRWMAPEALENHIFTTQADVWSFGVLMWEICELGTVPYNNLKNSDILTVLKRGYRLPPPEVTKLWYDLMLECWYINPSQRLTFNQLAQKTKATANMLYCQT